MAISRPSMNKLVSKSGLVKRVMHEFKVHTLKSSSGQPVTNKSQAIAIALSEAKRARRPRRAKKTT